MPLDLMLAMDYEEDEESLAPGDTLLFYSDRLVEAHNPARRMLGFPRLAALLAPKSSEPALNCASRNWHYRLGNSANQMHPPRVVEDRQPVGALPEFKRGSVRSRD